MDIEETSASQVRDLELREEILSGRLADPEAGLFAELLRELPGVLESTPLLAGASWNDGEHDLLFTDGRGRWCAVEVKAAPKIYGSGRQRRNRNEKARQKRKDLVAQAHGALRVCQARFPGHGVRALALWWVGGTWTTRWDSAAVAG